jgi:sugar transferase (PEP-CTERM/EpsH1 system associated)
MPYPPYRGDKLKIFNLAKQLAPHHELHLLTIAESHEDIGYGEQLKSMRVEGTEKPLFTCVDWVYRPALKSSFSALMGLFGSKPLQLSFFYSKAFKKRLDQTLLQPFDAIHVQHLRMGQYFDQHVPAHAVLDLPDAFSLYWKRRMENAKNPIFKWFNRLEYRRMHKWEQRLLPQFPLSLVCSVEDRTHLLESCQLAEHRLGLLPNGVDDQAFAPKPNESQRPTVLFTGNMDYAPNVDAVQWFAESIWPLIQAKMPEAQWVIAGQRPVSVVRALESDSVRVLGFVEDLSNVYAQAHVLVSPLRLGAGTQNKVLEAMSMGVPVVCTSVGFFGLGISSGDGVVLAKNASQFAESVLELLSKPEQAKAIGNKGWSLVQERFSWRVVARQLEAFFGALKGQ